MRAGKRAATASARAAAPPAAAARRPQATATERRDGAKRPRSGTTRARLPAHGTETAVRDRDGLPCARLRPTATRRCSPRAESLLPERRQLDLPEELDLVAELHPVLLGCATTGLGDQLDRVLRAGAAGVLDEVRVLRRDLRPADAVTLETARLEHPPGGELVLRVLEHAPEGAPVR